ncbi:DUF4439 domain-containing protein [Pseudokineococcus sp. 1T1Z-3]|uniref:DUF4439 domain-containing protein n=1 Tax=Pseudokineococcus sp. 1T1Z-3 TaxID=3132745 RepID=UPI0030A747E6
MPDAAPVAGSRPRPAGATSRRRVLGLLVGAPLLATGGCGWSGDVRLDRDWPGTPPDPVPDADELARRRAADASRRVRAQALSLSPTAATELVVAVAGRHFVELGATPAASPAPGDGEAGADRAGEEPAGAAPLPTDLPTDLPTGLPADPADLPPAPPPTAADLVGALLAGAREAGSDVPGTSAGMARLLASVAASRWTLAAAVAADAGLPAPEPPPAGLPAGEGPAATPGPAPEEGPTPGPDAGTSRLADLATGALAASRGVEVAAASLGGDARARALALRDGLAAEADALAPLLLAAGLPAPVPAPGYVLPAPLGGPDDAVALVVTLLDRLSVAALAAVPALPGRERLAPARVLTRTALAARTWRPGGADEQSVALPGTTPG